jgi:hypothetical protein
VRKVSKKLISNAVGYYLRPTVWVIDAPTMAGGDIDPRSLDHELLRVTLNCGVVAGVQRQGLFVFDFTNWRPGRAIGDDSTNPPFDEIARVQLNRVEVVNAHLACLYSAISTLQNFCLEKMSAAPEDLIYKNSIDDSGMSFGNPIVMALALAPYPGTYPGGIPRSFDWRLNFRMLTIQRKTIETSFEHLDQIIAHPSGLALSLSALLTQAAVLYESHNYSLSLVISWTLCERLLFARWAEVLQDNRRREFNGQLPNFITGKRMEKLTGRDFTASVVSETLSLLDRLPFELYENLERVRKARNSWVHGLESITRDEAARAFDTSQRMLAEVLKVELNISLSSRIKG